MYDFVNFCYEELLGKNIHLDNFKTPSLQKLGNTRQNKTNVYIVTLFNDICFFLNEKMSSEKNPGSDNNRRNEDQ